MKAKKILTALLLTVAISGTALAHRVNVFGWSEGNTVQVESRFSDSSPVKQGKIEVLSLADGRVLKTGSTASDGTWSFTLSEGAAPKGVKIQLSAGEGHAASWEMKPEELPASAVKKSRKKAAEGDRAGEKAGSEKKSRVTQSASAEASSGAAAEVLTVARAEIERIASEAAEEKAAPLRRQIAELQAASGPSAKEIIGGIGWIFGLAGAWALGAASGRKKRGKDGES